MAWLIARPLSISTPAIKTLSDPTFSSPCHKRVKVYDASDQWIDTMPRRVSSITDPPLAHMLSLLPVSKIDESRDTETGLWVA